MKTRMTAFSVSIVLVLLLALAPSAAAAPAKYVHIEVTENIPPYGTDGEDFWASGPAVDAGDVCESGSVTDIYGEVTSEVGKTKFLQAQKTFTCDTVGTFDEGDTFTVELSVRLNTITRRTSATWSVIGGTGAFASLQASGSLVGTPVIPGESILDVYDGIVR